MQTTHGTQYLESGFAANVFSREEVEGKNEYLSEVGLFLLATEGIEVYVNAENDSLNSTTLVATATGSNALEAGYHVIKLASPVLLTGEKFVVAVKYINTEENRLPLECNLYDSGHSTDADDLYSKATSNPRESFYSRDGENWVDFDGYTYGTHTYKNTNACIKAFSTYSDAPDIVTVTGVALNKETDTVIEGETIELTATVQPENATNKNILWTSSNENIATVSDQGVITGVTAGIATITVTTEDGSYQDTCIVTVNKKTYPVTGITLNKESAEIYVGNSTNLVATVLPENASNKAVTWTSSDTSIATVSNQGVVTGIAAGTATITVTAEDGNYQATCTVIVKNQVSDTVAVTGVTLNKESAEIYVGNSTNLVVTVSPANASNKAVTWTSSDTSIATVSNQGVVTGVAAGTATITVTTIDGNHQVTCTVIVKNQVSDTVAVTGITLNKETAEIYVGNSTSLVATVSPTNASNKAVTWTSSDASVATVSNQGVVTGVKQGTATITATTEEGSYKATCTITVKNEVPATVAVTGVALNIKLSTMHVGDNSNLIATISPTNASNKAVTWTSSDTSVATVSDQGIITALKEGKTTITVTTVDGKYKASCELTVTKKTNNDDDIYQESRKDNTEPKDDSIQYTDDTQITGKLPQTGDKDFLGLFIVVVSGIAIFSYIKYRKNKDIK